MLRLRIGFVLGCMIGYYLGAKAGRQRYEQLNRLIGKASRSDAVDTATDKAKTVIDVGFGRAKTTVQDKLHRQNNKFYEAADYSPS